MFQRQLGYLFQIRMIQTIICQETLNILTKINIILHEVEQLKFTEFLKSKVSHNWKFVYHCITLYENNVCSTVQLFILLDIQFCIFAKVNFVGT